jgi:PAS domain S-box-containing protein
LSGSSVTPRIAPPRLNFHLPPEPAHLRRARERIRDYLGQYCAERQVIDDVVLCVEEACTNAIRHSGALDDIEIALQFSGKRLVALVKDRGRGFDIARFDPKRTLDLTSDHGRGLFIVAALMDSLQLRCDGGLEVRMVRRAEPRFDVVPLDSGLGAPRASSGAGHSEARTRALLEEIDEAFVALDWEYRYIYVNEPACRLLDRSLDELLGRRLFALFPKLRGSDLERAFRAAMELGSSTAMEWRSPVIGAWVETRVYPTASGVIAYFHDIGDRKRKEEERDQYLAALRDSEQRLRSHVENTPMAVLEWDAQFVVTRWSGEAERMFGWTEAETVGKPITDLNMIYEADIPTVEATMARLTDGVSRRVVSANRNVTKDGRVIDCTWYNSVLLDAGGTMSSVMSLVSDETVRKRADEERRRLLGESQAQAKELQLQSEEAQVQNRELLSQRATIVRESELRAGLNAIGALLYSTLEVDEVMRRALGEAVHTLAIDAAAIELNEGDTWPVGFADGLSVEVLGRPLTGVPVIARFVALAGEALVLDDAAGHETVGPLAARYGIHSLMAVPLVAREQTLGVLLLVERRAARHFEPAEVDFARGLGTSVGLALENARRFEAEVEAERQARQELESTSLLLETSNAVASWTDLDQMLESLADLLVRSTDHSRVVLELWDEELQDIEIAVSRGTGTTPMLRFEFDDISDAVREVITTKKTAVIDYAQIGLPGPLKQYLGQHAFLLLLVVPIVYRDRFIGLIMVDQPGERRPFSPREIGLVEAIAAQAGAAIENARLLARETEAARFEQSATWNRATRLVRRLRAHPWGVLAAGVLIESAILLALNAEDDTRHILGVPGSAIALAAVVAGALAGPLVGALVAAAGGGVFFATVAGFGSRSSVSTTAISTAIWLVAGLVAGFLAKGLREQTERRRAASVALARAEAARETQLAEQSHIEELATGLQAQTDALAERADLAEALNAINGVVHSTLDFDDIMGRALAQGVAALHTDAGTIVLREKDSWVVTYQQGLSAEEVGRRLSVEQAPIASRVAATAQPLAVTDLTTEPQLNVGFPRDHGLVALLAVPLMVRQEVIGGLVFWERGPRPFSETEVDFARQLGATVSLSVDNAHLYLDQQRIAITLQENFIHPLPTVAGLELGMVAQAATAPELVGGDFSDVFLLDDTHVVVLIGDVAGKGVRAAGHTETVRSTVRALAAVDSSPAFILGKTNELFLRFEPDEPLVTAFLAVLNPRTGHLNYASAGHLPPVHLGAFLSGLLDVVFGPPLGSFEHEYANAYAMLTLEDYLVLYTDGLTEARHDGELFGEQRLLEAVSGLRGRSAQEVAEGLRDAALAFAGRLHDDLQVVVLRLA